MDDNRQRFESRLRYLDENPGIVSRAVGSRRRRTSQETNERITNRMRPLRTTVRIFFILLGFFIGKAIFAEIIGIERYDSQVAALSTSQGWRPLVALVMQRGPAMKWVEPGISRILDLDPDREVLAVSDWPEFMQVKGYTGE